VSSGKKTTNPSCGDGGTPANCTTASCSGLPNCIPRTCKDAPKTVTIPKSVNDELGKLWGDSFPGGKSQEQGGTIVEDDKGNLSVVNTGSGDSGSFMPNRNVPSGQKVIGICHTHPYDESEGGYTGVSFSGADIAIAANEREPDYVQSGDKQFMIMPTDETPNNVDYDQLNKDQNARIKELTDSGKSLDEASRIAAKETAQKYKMAYYEGSNGVLDRVSC
jgi:type VI secretion system secreted protein VgrG